MTDERNRDQTSGSNTSQGGPSSSTQDLKEREHRDKQGNIHHHTHTAESMHENRDTKAS
jgi:hypothetical protein